MKMFEELDGRLLAKLPNYMQSRLSELYAVEDCDGRSYWWAMEPNPGDEIREKVVGHSYSLADLRCDIRSYIRENKRLGFDY